MHKVQLLTAAMFFAAATQLPAQPAPASTPPPAAASTIAPAEPTEAVKTLRVDPVHSFVLFGISHMTVGQVWGSFDEVAGTITFDPENLAESKIELEVALASIHTHNEQRDTHLKSADFFDVEQFPTAKFTSEKIESIGEKKYRVTGTLDLHGVQGPVTAEVTYGGSTVDPRSGTRVGAQTTLTIDRTQFGMNTMVGPAGKDVTVIIAIEAVSGGAPGRGTMRRPQGAEGQQGQPGQWQGRRSEGQTTTGEGRRRSLGEAQQQTPAANN